MHCRLFGISKLSVVCDCPELVQQSQSMENSEVALSQIQEMYRKFASECPSGNLHLHEFKRIFGITCDSSFEESAYMENLFRSFDMNHVHIRSDFTGGVHGRSSERHVGDGAASARPAAHSLVHQTPA
ncbi:hypothetical protein QTP70_029490 [Hemibagrus guttatus]|uniref:Uncharacterized protein n=1 Tax=Hemibagrus guttatus TaxID=175788 RepID=A0AAE0V8W5_9TELE|nr:hypothetical protein QTP70_029490 [Hemibagrus guttatus]